MQNEGDRPRITRLRREEHRLGGIIEDRKQAMNRIANEGQKLDAKIKSMVNVDDQEQASRERAKMKFRFDQLGHEMRAAEAQLARVTSEREQWTAKFEYWKDRRDALIRELGTAIKSDAPIDPFSSLVGRETVRSHQQVKFELEQVNSNLQGFSN